MNRRDLFKIGAVATAATLLGGCTTNNKNLEVSKNVVTKPLKNSQRVIIIGGGYAGLTVAKNIKVHNKEAEVLVFDPRNIFASCPYSNLWLGGVKGVNYDDLLFSPLDPAAKYGYGIVSDKVVSIDRKRKIVSTLGADY